MSATMFRDDDEGYFAWIGQHDGGFVLNTQRARSPGYMVLHRARCHSIGALTGSAREGGFTARKYVKVCAATIDALRAWVRINGRPDGSLSRGSSGRSRSAPP